MREYLPVLVVGMVVLYIVAVSLSESTILSKLRSLGVDLLGERAWTLLENPLSLAGLATLITAIWVHLESEQASPLHIFSGALFVVSVILFSLALHRTGFFKSRLLKCASFAIIAGALLVLRIKLPFKKASVIYPISGRQSQTSPELTSIAQPIPGPRKASATQHIDQKRTAEYKALQLSKSETMYLQSQRAKYGNDYDGWRSAMARQFSALFATKTKLIIEELNKCGADTQRLSEDFSNAGADNPAVWYGVADGLREAALDIPDGQPQCGTQGPPIAGFREKETNTYTITLGLSSDSFSVDQSKKGESGITIGGFHPIRAYVLDGHFYVDTVVYVGFQAPAVKIKRNEIELSAAGIDRNFTDKAIEVVANTDHGNPVPIFQIIFQTPHRLEIDGVFFNKDQQSVLIVTPNGAESVTVDPTGQKKITIPLKPIFKYPSWRHQGEYAD